MLGSDDELENPATRRLLLMNPNFLSPGTRKVNISAGTMPIDLRDNGGGREQRSVDRGYFSLYDRDPVGSDAHQGELRFRNRQPERRPR